MKSKEVRLSTIMDIVSEYYGLKTSDLKAQKRSQNIVLPRQLAMYLCRELTDASLPKIGEEFGGRDHTTVIHACNKIAKKFSDDSTFAGIVKELSGRVKIR